MESKELAYRKTLAEIGQRLNDQDMNSIRFICKAVDGLTKRDRELQDPLAFFVKLEERGVLAWDDTDFLAELLHLVGRKDCLALLNGYRQGTGAHSVSSSSSSIGVDTTPLRTPVQTTSLGQGQVVMASDGIGYCKPQADVTRMMYGEANMTGPTAQAAPSFYPKGPIAQASRSIYPEDLTEAFETVVEEVGRNWRQLGRKLCLREPEMDWIAGDHPNNLREQCMQCLVLWQRKAPSQATKSVLIQALRSCRMMYVADLLEGYQFR